MTVHDEAFADERPGGSNPSSNPTLDSVISDRVVLSRRGVLAGLASAGSLAFLGGLAGPAAAAPTRPGQAAPTAAGDRHGGGRSLLGFTAIPPSSADTVTIAPGYTARVLIPWGTPIRSSGPAWRKDGSNTAAEQAEQVGMHHDGMHYFPLAQGRRGNERGLLVLNHEYSDRTILYSDGDAVMTQEKVTKALNAHGVTVIEIARRSDGTWTHVDSPFNRRINPASTPVVYAGPVSGDHPLLQSELGLPARGTINNCSHGVTPWGTYLTGEENWNGYFGTEDPAWTATALEARYGVTRAGFGYRWHLADPRFDLARNRNELNRYGWVVEIDPFKPSAPPVKRTALGRVKHEGATCVEARGRVVVYTGDDEDKDYLYRFVSDKPWRMARARGRSPLDEGVLYVARFSADGTGEWLPLVHGQGPLTAANGWADQADVLIRTRLAADAVGATKLDRPEWVTVNPRTDDVFVSLTNGTAGGPVSRRTPNPYGQILRLRYERGDHTRPGFGWDLWVEAGDPQYDPTVTLAEDDLFGSPDGLWCDPDGRLWIETDISNSSQNRPDRGYDRIANNALLAADPATGEIRRFLVGPRGCEITGCITTPDQKTMFVNIQHPGEATTFWGAPTPANPRAVSNWPDYDPEGRPRPATLVITKDDGGRIGT